MLRHIARGYLYKEIAQRLGISAKTVEAHVSAVLRKLQLSNRHELSRWAVQRRLAASWMDALDALHDGDPHPPRLRLRDLRGGDAPRARRGRADRAA